MALAETQHCPQVLEGEDAEVRAAVRGSFGD